MPKIIPTKKNIGCQIFKDPGYPDFTPTIYSLSQYAGVSNSTTTIYVNGLNFLDNSVVYFSGQPCTTFFNTSRSIFFYVPCYPLPGIYNVVVKTPYLSSNSVNYTVL